VSRGHLQFTAQRTQTLLLPSTKKLADWRSSFPDNWISQTPEDEEAGPSKVTAYPAFGLQILVDQSGDKTGCPIRGCPILFAAHNPEDCNEYSSKPKRVGGEGLPCAWPFLRSPITRSPDHRLAAKLPLLNIFRQKAHTAFSGEEAQRKKWGVR